MKLINRKKRRDFYAADFIFTAEDTRRFLAGLGFVENAEVTVVSQFDGNLIVNIKDSRVAVNKEMARHIMV